MKSKIKIGSGLTIKKRATISDNATVKNDLNLIKQAIKEGLMDSIFTLSTFDRNQSGKIQGRNLTITEIDQQILDNRKSKLESIDFSLYQIKLFSKYLSQNVHSSTNGGYSANMILNFITTPELNQLVTIIRDEIETTKNSDFIEGKFNNQYGQPETLTDRITISLENKYHLQRIGK